MRYVLATFSQDNVSHGDNSYYFRRSKAICRQNDNGYWDYWSRSKQCWAMLMEDVDNVDNFVNMKEIDEKMVDLYKAILINDKYEF